MRFFLLALLTLTGTVLVTLLLLKDPGYVLIGYGNQGYETTLAFMILALLVLFAIGYGLLRLAAGLFRAPRQLHAWDQHRRALRARKLLDRGLIELSEGDWASAEKHLIKRARDSDNPLITYLAAARAAQQQGAHERRDLYLRLAHEAMPQADVAVGLTQAELQLAHRQMEQALATLGHLRTIAPRHAYVLKLLMKLYQQLGDWEQLRELLPELRRRHVIDLDEFARLETQVHVALLQQAPDIETLKLHWDQVPRGFQQDTGLVCCYASRLAEFGAQHEAERLVRTALHKHWDVRLVDLYGRLEAENPQLQMSVSEDWLREHEQDPVLLQAMGRIALKNQLWGKARSFLEQAIALQPTVEGYQLLGYLMEKLDDNERAVECFRCGMMLATGESLERLPAPDTAQPA